METWKLIVLGVTGLLVAAILIEVWLKRGTLPTKLVDTIGKESSHEKDRKPELGMEATDMDIVDAAARQNANLDARSWRRSGK